MTRRERAVVPATSPISSGRTPLTPHIEDILTPEENSSDQRTPGTDSRTPGTRDSRTPEVPNSRSTELTDSGTPEDARGPKWRALERKEARLRADQVQALAALRRQVAAQRRDRSEIITDNTLIRVAVDLLLGHADRLRGDTEQELLHSVQPRRRRTHAADESGTPGVTESVTPELP